jgi:hypothetical protein
MPTTCRPFFCRDTNTTVLGRYLVLNEPGVCFFICAAAGGPGEHLEVQDNWEGCSYKAVPAHVESPGCCIDVSCLS